MAARVVGSSHGGGPGGIGGLGAPNLGGPIVSEDIKVPDKMVGLSKLIVVEKMFLLGSFCVE